MEWAEKVKDFFSGEKKDFSDPQTRRQAFLILTDTFGQVRWPEFEALALRSIIARNIERKPTFSELEAEMRDVKRHFQAWLE
jgi:hypothetical protein